MEYTCLVGDLRMAKSIGYVKIHGRRTGRWVASLKLRLVILELMTRYMQDLFETDTRSYLML